MGLRGPIRKPDSVRGKRAAAQAAKLSALQSDQQAKRRTPAPSPGAPDAPIVQAQAQAPKPVSPDAPEKPEWLSPAAAEIWQNLLELLIAADVPVKAIDTYALSMAAQSLAAVVYWGKAQEIAPPDVGYKELIGMGKLLQKCQTDALVWLDKLGGTPSSRLRMGIKPVVKKQEGAIAQLLAGRRLGKQRVGAS